MCGYVEINSVDTSFSLKFRVFLKEGFFHTSNQRKGNCLNYGF